MEFLQNYGHILFGLTILFAGGWGVRVLPKKISKELRIGIFSSIIAAVFILLEINVSKTFDKGNVISYLVTFTTVQYLYDRFLRKVLTQVGLAEKEENNQR